jgi:hypothetical protein
MPPNNIKSFLWAAFLLGLGGSANAGPYRFQIPLELSLGITAPAVVPSAGGGTQVSFPGMPGGGDGTASLNYSAISVDFGAVGLGTKSAITTIMVSNASSIPATITGLSITEGPAEFSQTNDCLHPLVDGSFCTVSAQLKPLVRGARGGSIYLTSTAGNQLVSLAGFGTQSASSFGVTPGSSTVFDNTYIGAPQTRSYTVENTGDIVLANTVAQLSPTAGLSISMNNCPSSLAVGASCVINVTYNPSSPVYFSAVPLSVTSSNLGYINTLSLSGSSFKDNSIVWKGLQYAAAVSSKEYYDTAVTLCEGRVMGAYGWRLPSYSELYELLYVPKGGNSRAYYEARAWPVGAMWSTTGYTNGAYTYKHVMDPPTGGDLWARVAFSTGTVICVRPAP